MPSLTLYAADGSCSMVAYTLLTELNLPFTDFRLRVGANGIEAVDGSLDRAAYTTRIHPSGYVPALAVDDQILTENPAILRYIANLHPERHLLGATALEQARVDEWLAWLSGTVHGYGFAALWRPGRFVEDEAMFEAVQAKGMKTIRQSFERIEKRIVGPFAIGEKWTAPDVFLHTLWRWGKQIGVDMGGLYPRYRELARAIEKVPSLRRAMEVDGKPLEFPE